PGEYHVIKRGGDRGVVGHGRLRTGSTVGWRIGTRLARWNTDTPVFQRRNRVPTEGRGPVGRRHGRVRWSGPVVGAGGGGSVGRRHPAAVGAAGNSGHGGSGTRSPTRTGSPASANAAHACSRRESSVSTSLATRASPIAESTMARLPSAVRVESARSRE